MPINTTIGSADPPIIAAFMERPVNATFHVDQADPVKQIVRFAIGIPSQFL
jgi:hypothetical protein